MAKETAVSHEILRDFCRFLKDNLNEKKAIAKWMAEKRGIKEASAMRNINRMINYYLGTGKQARSGRKYLGDIKEYLSIRFDNILSSGEYVGTFPNYDLAKEYVKDISVLHIAFNDDFEPVVWRNDESP